MRGKEAEGGRERKREKERERKTVEGQNDTKKGKRMETGVTERVKQRERES